MKKVFYLFTLIVFALTSCEKTEINTENLNASSSQTDNINRAIRPIELGKQLNNPYSVENMMAALDSLKANPDSLSGCMKAPSSTLEDIEISATDLYVRFLPQDSAQYKLLKNDTTLTLFDFPLDYEIKQVGDYYKDPTLTGEYTWLYTRVPVGYTPPAGIKYEVIEELFILEHSPYYSVETPNEVGVMKAKSEYGRNRNEALRVLQAVSLYLTGNLKQDSKEKDHFTNTTPGMQKAKSYLTVKIFRRTITLATFYYPSGTLKVQVAENSDKSMYELPIKGVKMHFLTWFYWGSAYTNEYGYYESKESYILDPIHTIYFSGKNGNNSWDIDRVWLWGSCLWVQKYNLGVQSKDNYNATIDLNSDARDACLTNNAIYDYMTICDQVGLTRPPAHLQVALRVGEGLTSSSAPLFQNHTNTYTTAALAGFFYATCASGGVAAPAYVAYIGFLNSLPDIILSGDNLRSYQNTDEKLNQKQACDKYFAVAWHELSHASNLQRVKNEKGNITASLYWSSLVSTESFNFTLGVNYGKRGGGCWEQIALCEGWAYFREYNLGIGKFGFTDTNLQNSYFPYEYRKMFGELQTAGCSLANMEKSLTATTFAGFKKNLLAIYSSDSTLSTTIGTKVDSYFNNIYITPIPN